jgi:hypothetical protein
MATVAVQIDVAAEREKFEERAFAQYFLSTITRNPHSRMSAAEFVSVDCKDKSEFMAKDESGVYLTESLNPAWWAWQERAKLAVGA